MSTPLINPNILTEGQKGILRIIYDEAQDDLESPHGAFSNIGYGRTTLLISIFGEKLFKDEYKSL